MGGEPARHRRNDGDAGPSPRRHGRKPQAGSHRPAGYSLRYPTHSPSADRIQQADFPYPSK